MIDTSKLQGSFAVIYDRKDAIACLRMIVVLHKLQFCKTYSNKDIHIFPEGEDQNMYSDYEVGGMQLKVWT